jgi:hypothetical protein
VHRRCCHWLLTNVGSDIGYDKWGGDSFAFHTTLPEGGLQASSGPSPYQILSQNTGILARYVDVSY